MKMNLLTASAAILSLFIALPATALTIEFNPASQSLSAGSALVVDLVVSGLVDNATPSLGTFDLDVSFDSSVLNFSGATFGDQLNLSSLGDVSAVTPGTGTVNLFELSLESANDLDNLQAGSFTLATLSFNAIAEGTSSLKLTLNALGDSLGDPLTATVAGGSVIVQSIATVPVPPALPMLLASLLVIGTMSSSRQKRREVYY